MPQFEQDFLCRYRRPSSSHDSALMMRLTLRRQGQSCASPARTFFRGCGRKKVRTDPDGGHYIHAVSGGRRIADRKKWGVFPKKSIGIGEGASAIVSRSKLCE